MRCPGCYKDNYDGFCNPCKKSLFDGNDVSHILPFNSPKDTSILKFRKNTERMSISGVQLKYSLTLAGNKLKLTDKGGKYILKPIPLATFQNVEQTPYNEHLCMQLAKHVYKLETPPNAIVYFGDGSPAYLVRRFDVLPDGSKKRQEDFASLAGKTPDGKGDFKYQYSYEGIAKLMKEHLPAYAVEVEKFYRLVLFNYIIGNGDAHLKNFSVSETSIGDHILSPVYDLLCTKLHINDDSDAALDLFDNDFTTASFDANGFLAQADFRAFGEKLNMKEKRVQKLIEFFQEQLPKAVELISASQLNKELKARLVNQITNYTNQRLAYKFN